MERFEPVLEDDSKPRAVGTETQTRDRLTTPSKRRNSSGDPTRGMPGVFDEYDTSPALSTQSDAPSPLFSIHDSDLDGTPDTTHSREFDFDTTGKGPCTRKDGTDDPDDPIDSKMFNSTASRAAPGAANSWMRPLKPNPTTGNFGPEFRSGKRPPRAACDQLETPTKTRTAPRDVAPSPDGGDEHLGASYTHQHFTPNNVNQFEKLRNLLDRLGTGIKPVDTRCGYIYIFKRTTAPGFLKIGRATGADGERMKVISRKCDYKDEARLVDEQYMDVAVRVVEKCVHDHLSACLHWDERCQMMYEEKKRAAPDDENGPCNEKHWEWFRTSEERAMEVVGLWKRFLATTPYEKGRLNPFWRNELARMWDRLSSWEQEETPALIRWDAEMRGALVKSERLSKGSPMAELPLRLVVRCEGEESVLEVVDETSGKPLLTVPCLSRRERV